MKKIIILLLFVLSILGCLNKKETNSLLSTQNLSSEFFNIDINKDTLLRTGKGALIKIPKGAITSSAATVQLEVKEAYSMEEIIQAGLITSSNGEPLSSGGMIYINAVGESTAKITKAISIATPTNSINEGMQIFKGEAKDGKINWTQPTAQTKTPQMDTLALGKSLFQSNCSSCHNLYKKSTGPSLIGVTKRKSRKFLYDFTNNPTAAADGPAIEDNLYLQCLLNHYSPTVMTAFSNFSANEMKVLYDYIENESNKYAGPPTEDFLNGLCIDSCVKYHLLTKEITQKQALLRKKKLQQVIRKDETTTTPLTPNLQSGNLALPPQNYESEFVTVPNNQSLYYQFTIESFGWYNIDIFMKEQSGAVSSTLMVRIRGQYKSSINMYLIVPSFKVLLAGGYLKDKKDVYGFDKNDGSIPLPQGVEAYIIGMGEYEEKMLIGIKKFTTTNVNDLDIELFQTSKDEFNSTLKKLNFLGLTINASKTVVGDTLKQLDKELKQFDSIKPKNCNCDCFTEGFPKVDTSIIKESSKNIVIATAEKLLKK